MHRHAIKSEAEKQGHTQIRLDPLVNSCLPDDEIMHLKAFMVHFND